MPKRPGENGMPDIMLKPPVAMGAGLLLPGDALSDAVAGDLGESGGEGLPAFGLADGEERELEGEPAEKTSSGDFSFFAIGSSACHQVISLSKYANAFRHPEPRL